MQPHVRAATSAAVRPVDRKRLGTGGILLLLGVTVGIYALSPGARHFYKHGYLPPDRRRVR